MTDSGTQTPRERYRAQVRAEVKERAWEQIATAGASALSLNAIAKQMGMSGPALYRYFASRDDLITELIRDAYRSLADTLRGAADSGADPAALALAMRRWALADPQRYLLIYGTPVPGYQAPADTTAISGEVMATLLDTLAAAGTAAPSAAEPPPAEPAGTEPSSAESVSAESAPTGSAPMDSGAGPAKEFAAHLADHRQWAQGHPAPPALLHRALSFWTRLHGVLSLEVAGQFAGMDFDPALLYAAEIDDLLRGA
ncbi:TetR/AcrR family transcriptional regulator [Streptomyces sp. NPDC004111]|uniref:TetR/AcrR family transcriptional regulator n=1 Tax=Streptomyces sp. NPDC004111 TaxID=3364690 RepID=UPI0036BB727A